MGVVALTASAAEKARQLMQRDRREGQALRVKVIGGGCSGLQYQLSFDERTDEWDQIVDEHGVRVVVDPKSAVYLAGSVVDYVDDLNSSGFRIQNPNASTTCGCGESFGV